MDGACSLDVSTSSDVAVEYRKSFEMLHYTVEIPSKIVCSSEKDESSDSDMTDDWELSSIDSDYTVDQIDGDPKDRNRYGARFPPPPSHTAGRFQTGMPFTHMNPGQMGHLPPRPGSHVPPFNAGIPPSFQNNSFEADRLNRSANESRSRHPHGTYNSQRNQSFHGRPSNHHHRRQQQQQPPLMPRFPREEFPPLSPGLPSPLPVFTVTRARSPRPEQELDHHSREPNTESRHSIPFTDSTGTVNVLPVEEFSEARKVPGIGEAIVVPALMSNKPISISKQQMGTYPESRPASLPKANKNSSGDILKAAMADIGGIGEFFQEEETPPVASETVIESSSIAIEAPPPTPDVSSYMDSHNLSSGSSKQPTTNPSQSNRKKKGHEKASAGAATG